MVLAHYGIGGLMRRIDESLPSSLGWPFGLLISSVSADNIIDGGRLLL